MKKIGLALFFLALAVMIFACAYLGAHYVVAYSANFSDPSWAQAIGAVLAILAGFIIVMYQVEQTKAAAEEELAERGRAAYLIAFDALETVTERLDAILSPRRPTSTHRLRGNRTTEMVAAMREFDTSRLPSSMLANFIRLRSRVYAINHRISEQYTEEAAVPKGPRRNSIRAKRKDNLVSSVEVWKEARNHFLQLAETATKNFGAKAEPLTLPSSITNFPNG